MSVVFDVQEEWSISIQHPYISSKAITAAKHCHSICGVYVYPPSEISHLKDILTLIQHDCMRIILEVFQPKLGREHCVQYFLMPETSFKLKVGMRSHTRSHRWLFYNTKYIPGQEKYFSILVLPPVIALSWVWEVTDKAVVKDRTGLQKRFREMKSRQKKYEVGQKRVLFICSGLCDFFSIISHRWYMVGGFLDVFPGYCNLIYFFLVCNSSGKLLLWLM